MSTHNIHFQYKMRQFLKNIPKYLVFLTYTKDFLGTQNEFESATVNEPSVFESLKFYCTFGYLLPSSRKHTYIIIIIIYIAKLGFTGVYIIFPISAQKHSLWYSLEPPRRGGSNEYPQSMFWAEIGKISDFLSENFHFLVVKFSVYLNRRVFVMLLSVP